MESGRRYPPVSPPGHDVTVAAFPTPGPEVPGRNRATFQSPLENAAARVAGRTRRRPGADHKGRRRAPPAPLSAPDWYQPRRRRDDLCGVKGSSEAYPPLETG